MGKGRNIVGCFVYSVHRFVFDVFAIEIIFTLNLRSSQVRTQGFVSGASQCHVFVFEIWEVYT